MAGDAAKKKKNAQAPVLTEAIDENVDWKQIGGMTTSINHVKECVVSADAIGTLPLFPFPS